MERIDDYDMLDKDLEGSMRYARECFADDAIANDERRDWGDRIRATAEILWQQSDIRAAANRTGNDRNL